MLGYNMYSAFSKAALAAATLLTVFSEAAQAGPFTLHDEAANYTRGPERYSTSGRLKFMLAPTFDKLFAHPLAACTADGQYVSALITLTGNPDDIQDSLQADKEAHFAGMAQYARNIQTAFRVALGNRSIDDLGQTPMELGQTVIDTANAIFPDNPYPWSAHFIHPHRHLGRACTHPGA